MPEDPHRSGQFTGLSQQQAQLRLHAEGPNQLPKANRRSLARRMLDVLREPMFALLITGGIIYWLLGDTAEALILLLFASLSVGITLIQESRSERVLDTLKDLASPHAAVIRDGQRILIPSVEVVREDLIVVGEGERVAADASILFAEDLLVDESLLTGESVAVEKHPAINPQQQDAHFACQLFAGTLVVRGSAIAQVIATGEKTEMGHIGKALATINTDQPHLQKQLRWLVRDFALFGGLAATTVVVLYGLLHGSWLQAFLGGIAIGMSLLPEEFPLVLAVFMAMGAWRISRLRVLTRKASAIETLGATTVLCTDKTGTLTHNHMTLLHWVGPKQTWSSRPVKPSQSETLDLAAQDLIRAAFLACPQTPSDPMDLAIHQFARDYLSPLPTGEVLRSFGLRPDLTATTYVVKQAEYTCAYSKGALEAIASLCCMSPAQQSQLKTQADELAQQGMRVLAVAKAPLISTTLVDSPRELHFDYLGMLAFADPLRASVPAAISQCHAAGIRVLMITGDYPSTASAIAAQAGLQAGDLITGSELESLSDTQLAEKIKTAAVFARIRPQQKLRLVQCLQNNGEVVAMTGDGVNDAPAIKAAHIGIAMGGRGTDVAREASAIVLLDDDFSAIINTIALGRRIYDNLRKAIEFIVAVHIPIAGLAIIPLLFGLPMILSPIHIAFLEMVIDPACSVVFEAEQEEDDVMQRPPRNPQTPLLETKRVAWAITQGLVGLVMLCGLLFTGIQLAMPENDLRSLVFCALVIFNMGLILINRSFSASLTRALFRPNRSLWILLCTVSFILALAVSWPAAQGLFKFGNFHLHEFLACVITAVLSILLLEGIKLIWFRR